MFKPSVIEPVKESTALVNAKKENTTDELPVSRVYSADVSHRFFCSGARPKLKKK